MSKTYYITTPIYYPNAEPHIGHCYTTIAADAIARYHRLVGDDTWFLTGTDEHGIKMVKTAEAAGIEPRALADRNVALFQQVWKELDISHDDFIRTTSDRHKNSVQEIVRRLLANGDIYLGSYAGWYDEGQEEFVTENAARTQEYKSAVNKKPLVRYSEPSYFLRLSKYVPRILAHIEQNPDFIQPVSRRNEVVSKLNAGVEDLSISRATLKWGIPMPNDPAHVLYVWIDALSNYITALGYASGDQGRFNKYWPVDCHLIGKEILWFHSVYWPAVLLSLGVGLPKRIYAHGWWTAEGEKMSKTLGNFIDLERIRAIGAKYSSDAVRYYLLRAAPFGNDLDWTHADFSKSYNELANVLGNCLNRTIRMIGSYSGGAVPPSDGALEEIDRSLIARTDALASELAGAYDRYELQQCALLPIELARATNGYIDATSPFKLKDASQAGRRNTILNLSAQAVYKALVGMLPILPHKAAEALNQLGVEPAGKTLGELWGAPLPAGHKLGQGQALFPKVEG